VPSSARRSRRRNQPRTRAQARRQNPRRTGRQRAGGGRRAHQRDPLGERQIARDEASQSAGHGRVDARALQRPRRQRHRLQRLDRLPDALGDVLRPHTRGEQFAGAAIAALRGERGGDEVAGPGQTDERLGQPVVGESPDDLLEAARGDAEEHEVGTREAGVHRLDAQLVGQLDAREVGLVLAVGRQAAGLVLRARVQRRARAAAGQEHGNRGAKDPAPTTTARRTPGVGRWNWGRDRGRAARA
jgi:hypothetical protein